MLCICVCVCTFFICGWVGQVGKCVARGSQLAACFILFRYFKFIDSNIPHRRLSALNFSVKES